MDKEERKKIKESKAKIKAELIEILYKQGYISNKNITAKEGEAIDRSISRRFKFSMIDYHVESLFKLEGWVTNP